MDNSKSKKIIETVFLLLFILCLPFNEFSVNKEALHEVPFKRGVNLSKWLEVKDVRQIQFTKYAEEDFINIKKLGCDVIRLPIDLKYMTNGAPNYIIDPLFFNILDQIVDWAEKLKIHLILDNHTLDTAVATDPNIDVVLIPLWTQMAKHYKDRSTYIYYEIQNEPHGISDAKWNEIQQKVIDKIREIDQKHTIIIGPPDFNNYKNLEKMSAYKDSNLIYTFHFYDPWIFTSQGVSWSVPPVVSLSGVPFPYDKNRMPACPKDLKNTWIEDKINDYKNEGNVQCVKKLIDIAVDFGKQRHVPLFCGEFGGYMHNCNQNDRVYWHEVVRKYLEEKNIAWTLWEYQSDFGIFKKGSNELFDYDLNIPLIKALDLNEVAQKKFILQPEKTEFYIYADYIEKNIHYDNWISTGILDYYSTDKPAKGAYCIYWKDASQYNKIGFKFKPPKDFSLLIKEGFIIDFWLRSSTSDTKIKFDIRFVDTKTDDPLDHPWRNKFTIDQSIIIMNGKWQHIQIPLKDFIEAGAWENAWFNPMGKFDWSAINTFEIVAEHCDLKNTEIWIDEIRIVAPKK